MTSIGNYKGNPTLSLNSEQKYPFTFGVAKAKAILENLADIRDFVARFDKPTTTGPDRHDMAVEDQKAATVGR